MIATPLLFTHRTTQYNNLTTLPPSLGDGVFLSGLEIVHLWPNPVCGDSESSPIAGCEDPTADMVGGKACYAEGCSPEGQGDGYCELPGIMCNIEECDFDAEDCGA